MRYVPGTIVSNTEIAGPDFLPLPEGSLVSLINKRVESLDSGFWIQEEGGTAGVWVQATPAVELDQIVTVNGVLHYSANPTYAWVDPTDPRVPTQASGPYPPMVYLSGGSQSGASIPAPESWLPTDRFLDGGLSSLDSAAPFIPYRSTTSIAGDPILAGIDAELGSIGYALGQLDGTVLDLIGVQVLAASDEGRTIGLKESYEPAPKVPRLALRLEKAVETLETPLRTIDIIKGSMTTMPDGRRAVVSPEGVYIYTDAEGNYLPGIPTISATGKHGEWGAANWPWKARVAP